METQFFLLEIKAKEEGEKKIYIVLFPLVDGSFKPCLQGNENNTLDFFLGTWHSPIKSSSVLNLDTSSLMQEKSLGFKEIN